MKTLLAATAIALTIAANAQAYGPFPPGRDFGPPPPFVPDCPPVPHIHYRHHPPLAVPPEPPCPPPVYFHPPHPGFQRHYLDRWARQLALIHTRAAGTDHLRGSEVFWRWCAAERRESHRPAQ